MEIERKFLINTLPDNLDTYDSHRIEQGYLCTDPVVRVRREDDSYYLTYKGRGLLAREEYNLPLAADSYAHLLKKADGNRIMKTRYLIPLPDGHTVELDIFDAPFAPLQLAEVEFASIEEANAFQVPEWFGTDVTYDTQYHNSNMASRIFK